MSKENRYTSVAGGARSGLSVRRKIGEFEHLKSVWINKLDENRIVFGFSVSGVKRSRFTCCCFFILNWGDFSTKSLLVMRHLKSSLWWWSCRCPELVWLLKRQSLLKWWWGITAWARITRPAIRNTYLKKCFPLKFNFQLIYVGQQK